MYGDDGPDDDYMTTEQALDAGWLTSEDTEELREILRRVLPLSIEPKPGDTAWAALILLHNTLNGPPPTEVRNDWDAIVLWARVLLKFD